MTDLHCVHLDFHTSDEVKNIGADFSEEEFISALKVSGIDSISIFAKCHHGCFYYPSEKHYTHPYLSKPLLDLQVEACKKAGVSSKLYISAGLDERQAVLHPEWLRIKFDGTAPNMLNPAFHRLCFNTPYLDLLAEQTEEVVRRYMPDGIFLDIVAELPCCCTFCRQSMSAAGLDFTNLDDVKKQARITYRKMTDRIIDVAKSIKPDILVFFNAGNIPSGNNDYVEVNSQLEVESLPTGGWGYDHFPMTMSYVRRLGKNCIGMTGKFHRTWGEFGGFKYKDALMYEGAQCVAFDAGLSVGDQLHPSGRVDMYTYENVGNAVRYIKQFEPWRGGDFCAELAILDCDGDAYSCLQLTSKTGISRMLFEAKYLFDIISPDEISNKYPLIILANSTQTLSEKNCKKLKEYVANGGKLLGCYNSPVCNGTLAFDLGAKIIEKDNIVPAYIIPEYHIAAADGAPLLIKLGEQMTIELADGGACLANKLSPYFKRNGTHFCSHFDTPCDYEKVSPSITEGKDGIYIGADLFTEYADYGSLNPKQLVLPLVEKLLNGRKTIKTNLPSSGKAVLYEKDGSLLLHLLYANTIKRGKDTEIIEDIVTLADINVSILTDRPISEIISRPSGKKIDFTITEDNRICFTLDKFKCYEILELK